MPPLKIIIKYRNPSRKCLAGNTLVRIRSSYMVVDTIPHDTTIAEPKDTKLGHTYLVNKIQNQSGQRDAEALTFALKSSDDIGDALLELIHVASSHDPIDPGSMSMTGS